MIRVKPEEVVYCNVKLEYVKSEELARHSFGQGARGPLHGPFGAAHRASFMIRVRGTGLLQRKARVCKVGGTG